MGPSRRPAARVIACSYSRAVNLFGGDVVNVAKIDVDKEELYDASGMHNFPPQEVDKYVKCPELMLELIEYARRGLARLSDEEIVDARAAGFVPGQTYHNPCLPALSAPSSHWISQHRIFGPSLVTFGGVLGRFRHSQLKHTYS